MSHQPQQILIKVMCSERLPDVNKLHHVQDDYASYSEVDNRWSDVEYQTVHPEYWYEPATRIVLTEEELQDMLSDARSEGYDNASMDAGSRY
jgi:hypothetical protein